MHKSYQNFWQAKAPEIKYIPWGVYCMLHGASHFMAQYTTAIQQR